jgi:hypothetical protein
MTHRTSSVAAAALLTLTSLIGTAQADGVRPGQATNIDLGDVVGVAYYTAEPNGYRVVVTLSGADVQQPVRFESVLTDAQSVTVSSPRAVGAQARSIVLTRKGDRIVVTADRLASLSN